MTDATTTFRATLETARTAAHDAWQKASVEEQAAWDLYRGEDFDHHQAWQAAKEIRTKTQVAYDQLDRACKTAVKAEADAKAVA